MDEIRITKAIEGYDDAIGKYLSVVDSDTALVKQSLRRACLPLKETVTLDINSCEVYLSRSVSVLTYDAEYHILRAYFHASPSLFAFLAAIWGIIQIVIQVINIINGVLKVITGEDLVYWLDQLLPGFQDMWNDLMNKISEFSSQLGWGVDGVMHLMNIVSTGSHTLGSITGKDPAWIKTETYKNMQLQLNSFSGNLTAWQDNPGAMLNQVFSYHAEANSVLGSKFMSGLMTKLDGASDKVGSVVKGLGDMTSEFMSLQNNMPELIAKNIPQGLWDAVGRADTMINDRLLPALTEINDKIEELDAVLESHRKKAEELADRLAHPGDLLAEIDKLPGYARTNQLVKIDGVTSQLMREGNEAAFISLEGDLTNFAKVADALGQPPAPLSFMELELPGRSPGITPEPHESWFVGDY